MKDLGSFGGYQSSGRGINDFGQVTGYINPAPSGLNRAFVYSGGVMNVFGGNNSRGFGINSSGQVTGDFQNANSQKEAFVYSGGVMTDLGTLGGGSFDSSSGEAINDAGQVTGYSYTAGVGYDAFLYSGGVMKDLGLIGGGAGGSWGLGINNSGQVVGQSYDPAVGGYAAFLYSGGVMSDLNTLYSGLLSDGSSPGFEFLTQATALNNNKQITGFGTYFDGTTTATRAFLLDTRTTDGGPTSGVPDTSSTLGLLTLSIGGLVLLRRQILKKGFRDSRGQLCVSS